jgi:hypothetical protein
MDRDPLLLSRIQFAFVVSFHIIFPASGSREGADMNRRQKGH